MYFDRTLQELELQPNSLDKIRQTEDLEKEAIKIFKKSQNYMKYLEHDFLKKNFQLINNVAFKDFEPENFRVYIYNSLTGCINLRSRKLFLYDSYCDRSEFERILSQAVGFIMKDISDANRRIEKNEQLLTMNKIEEILYCLKNFIIFDSFKAIKQNAFNSIIEEKALIVKWSVKKELLLSYKDRCFKERANAVNALIKHCSDLGINTAYVNRMTFVDMGIFMPHIDEIIDNYISNDTLKKFDFNEEHTSKDLCS